MRASLRGLVTYVLMVAEASTVLALPCRGHAGFLVIALGVRQVSV
jgi:hypothetical protein